MAQQGKPRAVNVPLAAKVAFLSQSAAYAPAPDIVEPRETHMSWVFLAGDRVYKLKKPVRFPYLDFSTLAQREAACRAELRLNRRLAPDIYLDVVPLTRSGDGLALGGGGEPVDWLVVMRRLDDSRMLDHAIAAHAMEPWQLDRLVATLARFYRRAHPVYLSPIVKLVDWKRSVAYNRRVLLDPRLKMPSGLVGRIDAAQRRFLNCHAHVLTRRVRERRLVDGHGDLRPEHICLDDPVRIIDCIEFNRRLRAIDPFDEIAFLSIECDRLGASWIGPYIEQRMKRLLQDGPADDLFLFYRCHRATLRARLAIAHLLEPHPRTPEKWPEQARAYLDLAAADTVKLERMLRKREYRSGCGHRASA